MDWGRDTEGEDGMAGGIAASYPLIRYRGKTWSIRANGEEKQLLMVVEGQFVAKPTIDVIVLGALGNLSRSFYPPGFDQASSNKRPTCSSLDGITPDTDAQQPQSVLCSTCPRYERRMNNEGKMSRECRDYKRVAVLIHSDTAMPYFGRPIWEPAFLRVPPDSLTAYVQFFDHMKKHGGWRPYGFVTRIGFDPSVPHPKFTFNLGAYEASNPQEPRIPPGQLRDYIASLLDETQVRRILGSDEIARKANRQALTQGGFQVMPPQAAQAAPNYPPAPPQYHAPVTGPVTIDVPHTVVQMPAAPPPPPPMPMMPTMPPAPPQVHVAPPPVAPPPPPTQAQVITPPPVAPPAPPQPSLPQQVQQATAEDVGAGATADPDLDAEIAALMGGKTA